MPESLTGALATISLPARSQTRFPVQAKNDGLAVIQPELKLFNKQKLICTNGVAHVEPTMTFRFFIDIFLNEPGRVLKRQIIALTLTSSVRPAANELAA